MAYNRSGATQAVAFDISKAFDRVWHAVLPHKLKYYGISDQVFGLVLSLLRSKQLRVVLDGKFLQECPVNVVIPEGCLTSLLTLVLLM